MNEGFLVGTAMAFSLFSLFCMYKVHTILSEAEEHEDEILACIEVQKTWAKLLERSLEVRRQVREEEILNEKR